MARCGGSVITYPSVAYEIQSLFSQRGLPTRVILNNPVGNAAYEIVFPMGKEVEVNRHLADANSLLASRLNEPHARLTPRTVLFYFAYQLFGEIKLPDGVFRSVNITNLQEPLIRKRMKSIVLSSTVKPLGIHSKWPAEVLHYDVDVILISENEDAIHSLSADLQSAVSAFNMDSDFLKVQRLRWGWSAGRLLKAKPKLKIIRVPVDVPPRRDRR